jgi:catechol 2,3-dioxygenase-like lactoylglutathione lyase family enzyme
MSDVGRLWGTGMAGLFPIKQINQVGLIVRDLDNSLRQYWETLGIGPWKVYTYAPPLVPRMTYRGKDQSYRMRLAFTQVGSLQLELIQPLLGESIYQEHLDRYGEGMHHIGVFVASLDEAISEATKHGHVVIQSGRGYGKRGDGGYAYLDTKESLGAILELIEVPRERVPPEMEFPPTPKPRRGEL